LSSINDCVVKMSEHGRINWSHIGISSVFITGTLVALFSVLLMCYSSWAINTEIPGYYGATNDVAAYNARAVIYNQNMPSPWNTSQISILTSNGTLYSTTKRNYNLTPSKLGFSFTPYTYTDYNLPTTLIPVNPALNTVTFTISFISPTNVTAPIFVTVPLTAVTQSSVTYQLSYVCLLYSPVNNTIVYGTQLLQTATVGNLPEDCSSVYGTLYNGQSMANVRFQIRHVSDPYIVGESYYSPQVGFYFGSIIFLLFGIFVFFFAAFLLLCATIYTVYFVWFKKE